ncbi:MAG: hypothetical protein ACREMY_25705, partial [bacterium]
LDAGQHLDISVTAASDFPGSPTIGKNGLTVQYGDESFTLGPGGVTSIGTGPVTINQNGPAAGLNAALPLPNNTTVSTGFSPLLNGTDTWVGYSTSTSGSIGGVPAKLTIDYTLHRTLTRDYLRPAAELADLVGISYLISSLKQIVSPIIESRIPIVP